MLFLDSRDDEDAPQYATSTFLEGGDSPPTPFTLPHTLPLATHTVILAVVNACLLLLLWLDQRRHSPWRNLPPGPPGLPLIGSLLQLRGNSIQRLREIALQYGPIFTIKLGMVRVFVLSEVDIIREAFVTSAAVFNDRPAFLGVLSGAGTKKGMVALEGGPFHRFQRLFTAEVMRAMGIGRLRGEKYFTKSLMDLCRYLSESNQRPFDAKAGFSGFVFQAFSFVLFGRDSEDNQSLIKLRDSPDEIFHLNPAFVIASKFLPRSFAERLLPNRKRLTDAFLELFERRRQCFKEDPRMIYSERESYVDGIIAIQHQVTSSGSDHDDKFHGDGNHGNRSDKASAALAPDDHYTQVLFDFFTVGNETSLAGLLWVLQIVMFHPSWQRRIQEELDQVVGPGGTPSLSHKSRLHVTMATITEVYRFRPVSALGAPHRVTEDTFLRGYFIPKGSNVLSNIYAANNDSKLWQEPDKFDPGRFLDEGGKFRTPQRMITFSAGPRSCPGEKWTHSLIFMFVTTVLKRFTLKFPDSQPLPDIMGHPGVNYSPCDFKICATPR